jgi:hypothetical protein
VAKFKEYLNESKIVYTGIFLTPKGKNELKKHYDGIHPNKYGHHITIEFGAKQQDKEHGETVSLKVVGYAKNDDAEAVVVELPKNIKIKNKTPHITISTANGIKPFKSNELLEKGYDKIKPFNIEGIVGYSDGNNEIIK